MLRALLPDWVFVYSQSSGVKVAGLPDNTPQTASITW
jgi:hypothetical protein